MHIKRDIGYLLQLRDKRDSQCEIWHEMTIHHINVDEIGTPTFKHADIMLEVHEIRQTRIEGEILMSPNTATPFLESNLLLILHAALRQSRQSSMRSAATHQNLPILCLKIEQEFLHGWSKGIAPQFSVRPNHSMTGNEQGNGVSAASLSHRLQSTGLTKAFRNLRIGACLAIGNIRNLRPDLALERRPFSTHWNLKSGTLSSQDIPALH